MTLISLPLLLGGAAIVVAEVPQIPALLDSADLTPAGLSFYLNALVASFLLIFGGLILGLLVVGTVPRLLNLAIEPGKVYPLYGLHYVLHRRIGRLTNSKVFTYLFGDSSFIVYYLRYIGYNRQRLSDWMDLRLSYSPSSPRSRRPRARAKLRMSWSTHVRPRRR